MNDQKADITGEGEQIDDDTRRNDDREAEIADVRTEDRVVDTSDMADYEDNNLPRRYAHSDSPAELELIERTVRCYEAIRRHLAYSIASRRNIFEAEKSIRRAAKLVPVFEGFVKSIIDYRYLGRDEVTVIDATSVTVGLEEKVRRLREPPENSPDQNFLEYIEHLAELFDLRANDFDKRAHGARRENNEYMSENPHGEFLPNRPADIDTLFELSDIAWRGSNKLTQLAQKFAHAGRKVKVVHDMIRGPNKRHRNRGAKLRIVRTEGEKNVA